MTFPLSGTFPVAIVGIGCRFPDASGPARFWQLLARGGDAIREIPRDRFDVDRLYDPQAATPGRVNTRWGGFLDDIDRFDIDFFDMSPREAERLDPQQRLLLETSWEALEDAGVVPGETAGSQSGVFVGMWTNEYEARLFRDLRGVDFYMTTGTGRYAASGRVSYALGWQGPSVTVDTGCSSSLVAVHLACQSLWTGETALALAAGVNIILEPHVTVAYSQSRMMAPDGRCKFGDARADGYVRSDGAGVIVLKPLDAARAAGDRIYATILGTAVTNDGRSSGFLTTPGSQGQTEMLRLAYQRAGVSPAAVTYVEAHGTGTRAGDPVEIGALAEVLGAGRSSEHPCRIGSVKTNIGHTEGAAGIAGLIKVALSLRHRAWPASLHCAEKNPAIPWATMPLVLQQVHEPWQSNGQAAIAGVNSFGISGTNAHAVLREHPQPARDEVATASARPRVLVLSGHTEAALDARVAQLRGWLAGSDGAQLPLADTCWTAAVRRTHHNHRATAAARDLPHLLEQLDGLARGEAGLGVARGRQQADRRNQPVFVFPGQGSQWHGMGRQLLQHEPVFRAALHACDQAVSTLTAWSVMERLGADESAGSLRDIDCIQPVLFSVQVALAALWRSWGVEPAAVVGHSMGEVAAAHVAGALTLDAAARIICRRSALLRQTSGRGAMAVVDLAFDEAQAAIGARADRVSVAASNSPRTTVLSGDPAALDELIAELEAQDVFCRRVKVDVASHSPQMDPLRADLLRELTGLAATAAAIPIYSTVSGRVTDGADFDADYWVRNLRQPVLFSGAVQALAADGYDTFIEVSSHPILTPAIEEGLRAASAPAPLVVGSLRRDEDERLVLLGSIGALHVAGFPIDWRLLTGPGEHVDLPPYPWQRERFWMDTPSALDRDGRTGSLDQAGRNAHPLLGIRQEISDRPGTSFWELELSDRSIRYLTGHQVDQRRLVPPSACLELVLAAVFDVYGEAPCSLHDVEFREPLAVPVGTAAASVQVLVSPDAAGLCSFRLSSRAAAGWTLHVCGRIDRASAAPPPGEDWPAPVGGEAADEEAAAFYTRLAALGLDVAPCLRTLARSAAVEGVQLADIELPLTSAGELGRYHAHPAALDVAFQLAAASSGQRDESFAAPVRIARLNFRSRTDRLMRAGLRASAPGSVEHAGPALDLVLWHASGDVACELLGVEVQQQGRGSGSNSVHLEDWLYELKWEPVTTPAVAQPLTASGHGRWLILADQSGTGAALGVALAEGSGAAAVLVMPGSEYAKQGAALYVARPGERCDLEAILVDAFPNRADCAGVVHLWSLAVAPAESTTSASLDGAETHAAHSAVDLVQAIAAHQWSSPPSVWFVTRGAQAVRDEERIAAGQAMVWGIGRTVREEHPEHWGGLIDLDPREPIASGPAIARWLQSPHGEDQLAIRGGDSSALRLARLELDPTLQRPMPVRRDGTYLIAGGLGDLGLQVARWLCEQGAKRLVLLGRTALPAREEWRRVDPASGPARQIAAIETLEAQGVSVRAEAVDVADRPALAHLLERLEQEGWPPLRGVVQCAGFPQGRLIQHLDHLSMSNGLQGKVAGSWNLHTTTLTSPLDFFVLFSSIASFLVSPGQAVYGAANAFQDALAADRRAEGRPGLSINWGPWALGMAADLAERGVELKSRGVESLATPHGLAAFSFLMQTSRCQASAMRFSWPKWQQRRRDGCGPGPLFSLLARESAAEIIPAGQNDIQLALRRQLDEASEPERVTLLESFLQGQLAQVLRRSADHVDLNKPLRAMGLDSLMALELRNRLEGALDLRLPATLAWNYPTVSVLARQLSFRLTQTTAQRQSSHTVPDLPATDDSSQVTADDLELLLAEVEQLSDQEATQLLLNSGPDANG